MPHFVLSKKSPFNFAGTRAEKEIRFLQEKDMFKTKTTLDRHNLRLYVQPFPSSWPSSFFLLSTVPLKERNIRDGTMDPGFFSVYSLSWWCCCIHLHTVYRWTRRFQIISDRVQCMQVSFSRTVHVHFFGHAHIWFIYPLYRVVTAGCK